MQRPYKITYKTYFNDRLKEVDFHGEQTYPLYVQVTYRKKTIFFKSYYFDLLSQERYAYKIGRKVIAPKLKDVIDFELKLIQFIVEKLGDAITLEAFKEAYNFYGQDLCSYAEKMLVPNLFLYFKDIDCDSFAWAVASFNQKKNVLYDLLLDMKKLFTHDAWKRLIQYGDSVTISYLEMYAFVISKRKKPYWLLTVMEWEKEKVAEEFRVYLSGVEIGGEEQDRILKNMIKLIAYVKEEAANGFS